jgi:hypothetical protein
VIVNKKLFKLTAEFVSKVTDMFNVGPAVILLFNGDEPIVTFRSREEKPFPLAVPSSVRTLDYQDRRHICCGCPWALQPPP